MAGGAACLGACEEENCGAIDWIDWLMSQGALRIKLRQQIAQLVVARCRVERNAVFLQGSNDGVHQETLLSRE